MKRVEKLRRMGLDWADIIEALQRDKATESRNRTPAGASQKQAGEQLKQYIENQKCN